MVRFGSFCYNENMFDEVAGKLESGRWQEVLPVLEIAKAGKLKCVKGWKNLHRSSKVVPDIRELNAESINAESAMR